MFFNQRRRSRSRSRNRQNRFRTNPRLCEQQQQVEQAVEVKEVNELLDDLLDKVPLNKKEETKEEAKEEPLGQLVPVGPRELVQVEAPRLTVMSEPIEHEIRLKVPLPLKVVPDLADPVKVVPQKGSRQVVPVAAKALAPLRPTKTRSLSDMQQYHPSVRELSFNVQLAHGSPTIKVTDFSSIVGLFNQISKGFKIQRDDIVFCTINTHKADMSALFTGSLEETDILFVHLRGQPVEVEMMKNDAALGVTIADNGLCRSFIKRIREQSVADAVRPALGVGQLIENIDGKSVLGLRHYEVAKLLRSIPVGKKFTMRLVNPLTSGFSFLQPRGAGMKKAVTAGTGMGTIRFKADGGIVVQAEAPDKRVIDKLNELFDSYLGVQDDELAQTVWDTANKCQTLQDMMDTVRNSELNAFDFPDELVFDMWGIVGDLKKQNDEPIKISSDRALAIPN